MIGALVAFAAACGEPNDQTVRSPAPAPAQAEATTSLPSEPTTVGAQADTATSTLPGEPCELFCPESGTVLAVAGITFDETLPLRVAPGFDQAVVATLPPLTDVVATGDNRPAWFEVTANGATGWADRGFLLYPDGTFDSTAGIVGELGKTPRAASMLALGRIVADSVASTGEVTSRVVVAVAPTEGVMGTVTYDVIGLPDDSIGGERLRVTGRRVEVGDLAPTAFARATMYELVGVESTLLCRRGSVGGLCV